MLRSNNLVGFGKGSAVTAAFLPSDIASLWTWIDPAVNSFQEIAGTTAATADGDRLGYLTDRSGNGRHWIAAADNTTRPVLKLSIVNGLPIIRYDASASQNLICNTSLAGLSAAEAFIVMYRPTDPQGNSFNGNWRLGSDTLADHFTYSDGNGYVGALSTARKSAGNPTPSLVAWRLIDIWSASSDYAIQIDGSAYYSTATNSYGGYTAPWLGQSVGGQYATQDIAEMCIFSEKLSTTNRTSMKQYIANKFALTIA